MFTVTASLLLSLFVGGQEQASLTATTTAPQVEDLVASFDWPGWRGPNGNGVANGPPPPTHWSESVNLIWKAHVPGRGHGSPTVVGKSVFLPTADDDRQVQSVVAFDRATGELLWRKDINQGGFPTEIHDHNTHATPTIAADGERLFAVFHHHESVQVTALDHGGNELWQQTVGAYQGPFGYAPSPVLYAGKLIIAAEAKAGSFLVALDCASGEQRWRITRPANVTFSSPIVGHVAGRDQLLLSGSDLFAAYEPATGKHLWSTEATAKATAGTPVWDGDLVFASGGHPKAGSVAVRADGSGAVVWQKQIKCYEQSMLAHNGHVYAVSDAGIAHCWRAADGQIMWKQRLAGGAISASPVLVGDRIYASNERGTTYVFSARPESFELFATNQLGDDAFATPSICGGRIYLRVGHQEESVRKESLYCVGARGG